ncbi:MAG TPA: hypothetical protein VIJ79_11250 [Acidobacteriaceae bacterium]
MEVNHLYTVLLDYAGGTYISQVKTPLSGVLPAWLKQLSIPEVTSWGLTITELESLANDNLIPLGGLENVWCASASGSHGLILINVVLTNPEP